MTQPNPDISYGLFLGLCASTALILPISAKYIEAEKRACEVRILEDGFEWRDG